jgi:hypothetical protein
MHARWLIHSTHFGDIVQEDVKGVLILCRIKKVDKDGQSHLRRRSQKGCLQLQDACQIQVQVHAYQEPILPPEAFAKN